jgi:hypothetical protein
MMVTPSPISRLEVEGGTASDVIDLASGPDPQILAPFTVTGHLVIGHTASLADPDAPVIVRQGDVIAPDAAQTIDLRCARCTATLSLGPLDGHTLALLEHEDGCSWFRQLLAEARS